MVESILRNSAKCPRKLARRGANQKEKWINDPRLVSLRKEGMSTVYQKVRHEVANINASRKLS